MSTRVVNDCTAGIATVKTGKPLDKVVNFVLSIRPDYTAKRSVAEGQRARAKRSVAEGQRARAKRSVAAPNLAKIMHCMNYIFVTAVIPSKPNPRFKTVSTALVRTNLLSITSFSEASLLRIGQAA